MFSTFLMWVLADLFTTLPEIGDVDKPKLVFFFDEAHLLFADASKAFLRSDVLHVPDVGACRPLHDAARDRRRRQAQAGVLLRRSAPSVRRRIQGVPQI